MASYTLARFGLREIECGTMKKECVARGSFGEHVGMIVLLTAD